MPHHHSSLSTAVIEAVADESGTPATELPEQLHEVVDPDALDQLFTPLDTGKRTGTIAFPFNGYHVTAYSDGTVEIKQE